MKALALVDSPDHVCCRYRIRAFLPALARVGLDLELASLRRGAFSRWRQLASLPWGAIVILQRKLLSQFHLRELRARAARLVFDFDDAILYRDSYDPRGPLCSRRLERFAATVQAADTVIAGNDFLADVALRAGARPESVRVIPTCVATERYQPRDPELEGNDGLELVWIGSSSTLEGLERDRPIWDRIGREVPATRLRVICDRFPDLGAMPVIPVPWSEATEAAELARADVGVSTMPDDLWSRGKCGLKLLQYQAAGLPVLANPVGVHVEMIQPGVTGFLPRSPWEWEEAVRVLASDPRRRAAMGAESRAAVERGYSVRAWEGAFVGALTGSTGAPPPVSPRIRAEPGAQAAAPSDVSRAQGEWLARGLSRGRKIHVHDGAAE